jgi:hypothetical protein
MKHCTVYGSCQAHALGLILNSNENFRKKFEYHPIKGVWGLTSDEIKDYNTHLFPTLDLFIYQPVINYEEPKTTKYITENCLKSGCQIIIFPFLYFTGYHPQSTSVWDTLNNQGLGNYHPECLYHDRNLITAYLKPDFNLEKFTKQINDPGFYDWNWTYNQTMQSLNQLRKREINDYKGYYIRMADFIQNNLQNQLLFWTINHPTKFTFQYLAKQIFNHLKIWINFDPNIDPLSNGDVFPIYNSVAKNLGLKFNHNRHYIRNHQRTLKKDVFAQTIAVYNQFTKTLEGRKSLQKCAQQN